MKINELKKEGLKGSFWNFLNMGINQLRNFVVSLVLARLLLPTDFGVIAMALVLNTILDSIVDFGLGDAIIRKSNVEEEELSTVFWLNILLGGACSLIVFLSAPLFSHFFEIPILKDIVKVTSFSFVIAAISSLQSSLFHKKLDFKKPFIARLISGCLSGITGIAMALLGYGVWSLVFSHLLGWITYSLGIWMSSSWRPTFIFCPSKIKDLWQFGWKMTLTTIINRLLRQLDTFIIGKLYSAASLGYYNRAKSLNNLIIETSFSAIRSTMLPTLSKLQDNNELLKISVSKLLHIIIFITLFVSGIMYVSADDIIILLYTEKWTGSIELFKILGLFSLNACLPVVYDTAMATRNKMNLYFWIGISRNTLSLLAIPIGLYYGINAYVWSVSIICTINLIPYIISAKLCINLGIFNQIILLVRYISIFFVSILIVKLTQINTTNIIINIISSSSYFAIIYVILNKLIKNDALEILLNILNTCRNKA